MKRVQRRLKRSVEKNGPEVRALLTGTLPGFILGGGGRPARLPVFTFHAVDPEVFETQLRFLRANEYRTVTGIEALSGDHDGRSVMLTFDDADWTFWAYAYPLLEKYDASATLFVVPGLIHEATAVRPNIGDVWSGRTQLADLAGTGTRDDVCSWAEIALMHASGRVNVQSHSMTHACIPTGPRVIDYVRPGLGYAGYKWVNVPLSVHDDEVDPDRSPRWGAPVLESASRLAGELRFVESAEFVNHMIALADTAPDPVTLDAPAWRRKLDTVAAGWIPADRGRYESPDARDTAMRRELGDSKRALEDRLGKEIDEFCYPWFSGCPRADDFAAEAGYRAVHYGIDAPTDPGPIARVRRLSEHFLRRLPGRDRATLWSIFTARVHGART
jgi:peptidoglycan/xylan/chitin deacetylase (PgdA/CDA1 family)